MIDSAILKAFLTLGASVVFISLLFFAIKKYALKFKSATNTIDLQILSKLSLQPKNHLYVIKAGNKTLLLGVSEKSITTLSDLTDEPKHKPTKVPFAPNAQLSKNQSEEENITESLSFKSFLRSAISKNN